MSKARRRPRRIGKRIPMTGNRFPPARDDPDGYVVLEVTWLPDRDANAPAAAEYQLRLVGDDETADGSSRQH
jgi:hypothetical protein